jgi:hypothetical protein
LQALRTFAADNGTARLARLVAEARLRSSFGALPNGATVVAVQPSSRAVSTRAAAVEARQGIMSAQRIAYEVAAPLIERAASWADLHAALAQQGVEYALKRSGAVIIVGDQVVKASRVGRNASRGRLEQRLGPFEAHAGSIHPRGLEPAPGVSVERLAAFDAARATRAAEVLAAQDARRSIHFEAADGADPAIAPVLAMLSAKARRLAKVPRNLNDIGGFVADGGASGPTTVGSRQADIPVHGTLLDALAYRCHREKILVGLRAAGRTPNVSRVDGWVAQRLRACGRDQAAVEAIIRTEARRAQPGVRRDWAAYAQRVAGFGFGPESTAYIAANAERAQKWRQDEEAAETRHWRAVRKRAIDALNRDLEETFVRRRMQEAHMRQRHRTRSGDITDVKWALRRLGRAGPLLAVLSALAEIAVVTPLLALDNARHAGERDALLAVKSRAAAELKEARRALRKAMRAGPVDGQPRAVADEGLVRSPKRPRRSQRGDGQGL